MNPRRYATFGVLHDMPKDGLLVEDPVISVYYNDNVLVGHAKLGDYCSHQVAFLFIDYASDLRLDLENGKKFYLAPKISRLGVYSLLEGIDIKPKNEIDDVYLSPVGTLF